MLAEWVLQFIIDIYGVFILAYGREDDASEYHGSFVTYP